MQNTTFSLHDIFQLILLEVRAAWRYRWYALIVAWCLMIVGATLVYSLSNKYVASTQVYADTEALSNPLLRGVAVQPNVRQRLNIITHTLLTRPNLESVADKTGLSARATTPEDKERLLNALGKAIRIRQAGTQDLYLISYADPDREVALKVVQAVLQILMNDTLGANTSSTYTAQNFLRQQVQDYSQKLNDAEDKLAAFQAANVGYIPDQGGKDYFTRLQTAKTQLQNLQDQYDTAVASRAMAQRQMRTMASGSTSSGIDPRIQAIDKQITSYRQQLNTLLLSYTEQYPDVISTRRMISQLIKRRDALQKDTSQVPAMSVVSDNPVYQEMQKTLYTTQIRIQQLATQISLQKSRIAELKSQAGRITGVQATLQKLTRNYQTIKKQYDQLLARLNTAQLTQDATQSGNNLKFQIVNPPAVPLFPSSPKRGLLLLVVFMLSLIAGGGFAYFLHKIKPVFTSLNGLRKTSGYHVLGAISLVVSQTRQMAVRREIIGFCAAGGLLAVVLVLGVAFDAPITRLVQHFLVLGPL